MQVIVKGKNMEVNDRLREWAEGKIANVERVVPGLAEAEVEFSNPKTRSAEGRYVAQVTLKVNGTLIRGEQTAGDTYSAMDAVLEKLERQLTRFKEKRQGGKAKGKVSAIRMPSEELEAESDEEEIESAEEGEGQIVRVKHFPMKPMDAEEAVEQMLMLGHGFFVFFNSQSHAVNVVYRRRDGNFGLIEPEAV